MYGGLKVAKMSSVGMQGTVLAVGLTSGVGMWSWSNVVGRSGETGSDGYCGGRTETERVGSEPWLLRHDMNGTVDCWYVGGKEGSWSTRGL